MKKSFCKYKKTERGQVLILTIMAVVILIVMVIVLFDLQRIIRGKTTVMSAVDAAAIAGATWQKHSLNLIGELNLIKACTVMISDSVYGVGGNPDTYMKIDPNSTKDQVKKVKEELNKLVEAEDLLTQMQVRVAFVGPLIGFGAAQQAAKNNGLPANEACCEYLKMMLEYVRDDGYYGNPNIAPQIFHDYAWREPYQYMLESLLGSNGNGIAVGTSVHHLGMPSLSSTTLPGNALKNSLVLDAIAANDWCLLMALLNKDISYSGKWWGDIEIQINKKFLGCSEILPLYIDHITGTQVQSLFDEADQKKYIDRYTNGEMTKISDFYNSVNVLNENDTINGQDSDMKINPLPKITWAIFNSDYWSAYDKAVAEEWESYLIAPFQQRRDYYSGALSYFCVYVPNKLHSRSFDLSQLAFGGKRGPAFGSASAHSINFNAKAKPFGRLVEEDTGKFHYPFTAGLILPVFDKVALVPISLEPVYGTNMADYVWLIYLTKYLPALGTVDNIDDVKNILEPKFYKIVEDAGYIDLIKKLADPEWRQAGIDWLDAIYYKTIRVSAPNNPDVSIYKTVPDGTNRDHCFDWDDDDKGGGGGSGSGGSGSGSGGSGSGSGDSSTKRQHPYPLH